MRKLARMRGQSPQEAKAPISDLDRVPAASVMTPAPLVATEVDPMLRLRGLSSDERPEAGRAWQAIEARIGSPLGMASWAWTDTWLAHYGDAVAHRFVVAERAGEPCAIALLSAGARSPLRPRALHLGTAGEPTGTGVFVEDNRLAALPEDRDAFAALLSAEIDDDARWDRLLLDGLTPTDAAALLHRWPQARVQIEECPVTDLTGDADVLDRLSGSRRRRIRATLRAFGPLELEWATQSAQAVDILDELVELHQRDWRSRGERGAFSTARFTAFHRAVVQRLVPAGGAAIVRIRRERETVACLYGIVSGTRLLFYQSGLRSYEDNQLRAGQAGHVLFMRACQAHGLTEYDFLAPAARYKLELSTGVVPLVWAEIDRTRWRTRLSLAARNVRER
jgi:CelD/BcsL family acetyltransferase involved in cellulose biosynthesis